MKEKLTKRGEYCCFNCGTPYCCGIEGRCLFCGGVYSECHCGCSNWDGCICGCHAISLGDIKNIDVVRLVTMVSYTIMDKLSWKKK